MANTVVQTATGDSAGTSEASHAVVFASAPAGASGIYVCACTVESSRLGTLSVSDDQNGSWGAAHVSVTTAQGGVVGEGQVAIFTVANTSASKATVTVSSTINGRFSIAIMELTGEATSWVGATASDESTSADNTIDITTTADNSTLVSMGCHFGSGDTNDTNFTTWFTESAEFWAHHFAQYRADAGTAGSNTITHGSTGSKDRFAIAALEIKTDAGGGVEIFRRRIEGY